MFKKELEYTVYTGPYQDKIKVMISFRRGRCFSKNMENIQVLMREKDSGEEKVVVGNLTCDFDMSGIPFYKREGLVDIDEVPEAVLKDLLELGYMEFTGIFVMLDDRILALAQFSEEFLRKICDRHVDSQNVRRDR